MERCHLLQMLAVLGAVALPTNIDRASAAEQILAQAAPTQADPASPAQQPKKPDDVPPGGCTPIGMTASGEMVFPLLCRSILEQQRGPISQTMPTSAPKPDAPVTASRQETVPADSAPAPSAAPQLATTPPGTEPPATTSESFPLTGATGKLAAKNAKRNARKRQVAGQHGAPAPAEVTGSVNR